MYASRLRRNDFSHACFLIIRAARARARTTRTILTCSCWGSAVKPPAPLETPKKIAIQNPAATPRDWKLRKRAKASAERPSATCSNQIRVHSYIWRIISDDSGAFLTR